MRKNYVDYAFVWPTMHNATHFILGQFIVLRIKNWQFDEACILHITLQQ